MISFWDNYLSAFHDKGHFFMVASKKDARVAFETACTAVESTTGVLREFT